MPKSPGPEKRAARRREPAKPRLRAEAPPSLDSLSPERLGDFLELALLPEELLSLCRKAGANSPGYRLERLSAPDHAALLADELKKSAVSRELIEEAVLATLKSPLLRTQWLTSAAAKELTQVLPGDPVTALARLAWRCLGDEDPALKAVAEKAIDAGVTLLDKAAKDGEPATGTTRKAEKTATSGAPNADHARQLEELERRATRAERDRESARAQLQQARSEVADRDRRLSELKHEFAELRVETTKQAAELTRIGAERGTDERRGAHESRKAAAERAHFEGKVADLEERLAAEHKRAEELARQLADKSRTGPAPVAAADDDLGDSAEAADFATPYFTDEFYESLEGWDRRIVKSAFEKALLLARDRRHPSLRAVVLEGLDHYFRIRVATDVRLIYRRTADGRIELLSLIDREDLERYVRQAKTRHA